MTDLTIPDESSEVEYGSVTGVGPFVVDFSFFELDDVRVSVNQGGVTTELTYLTDYVVAGTAVEGGYSGGSVSLIASVADATVRIWRSIAADRTTNFPLTGPLPIGELNTQLNRVFAILQEQEASRSNYLQVPDSAVAADPFEAGRPIESVSESSELDAAATNRQVRAAGPEFVDDSNLTSGPLTINQWNQVSGQIDNLIYGDESNLPTKTFNLMMQYSALIQNRNVNTAEFRVRVRYAVKSYSEVTHESSADYRIKVPGTSALPLNFIEVARNVDYTNGETVDVYFDIYPATSDSEDLYVEWPNFIINTSAP